jgi:hypothetical protein
MSKFKVGDRVVGWGRVSRKNGPYPSPVEKGVVGTVIDQPVTEYNRLAGCDMVLRLDDGRVGAACSAEWRPWKDMNAGASWQEIQRETGWSPPPHSRPVAA